MTDPYTVEGDSADREKWLAVRRSGIGASEVAAIMGCSPFASPLSVYTSKTLGTSTPETEPMRWGNLLESTVAAEYAKRSGRPWTPGGKLLRSTYRPWALATLDGWTVRDGKTGVLEIKTCSVSHGDDWTDGPPKHYYWQCQQQMLVTGAPFASISCLIGGQKMVWFDVERSDNDIAAMVDACQTFWGHVERREPPPSDGTWASSEAIKTLYPTDDGSVIRLPPATVDMAAQLSTIKDQLKKLESRKYEIENFIKAAIGTATVGLLDDGSSFSYKLQHVKERVSPPTSFRVLRRKERA